jgi:hypothetical protein
MVHPSYAAPTPTSSPVTRLRRPTHTRRLVLTLFVCATALLARRDPVQALAPVREGFDGPISGWQVSRDATQSGAIEASTLRAASGTGSARLTTGGSGSTAAIRVDIADAAGSHVWEERPGTYQWQRARIYVPASTIAQLSGSEYVTVGGFWANAAGYGWYLRVRAGGALSVVGHRDFDGAQIEFSVYGTLPVDRWFDLELGLHSQAGPGVKRAFAFLVDGTFYGWYHQGRMQSETYDRVAIGLLSTNSADALELFVDEWRAATSASLPDGPDLRSTATVQEKDFRTVSGADWQIDWSTWGNNLRLHPQFGIYSDTERLQSGRNLDRLPSIASGWAEIEIDWPKGMPPLQPSSWFGPMVGFRKEINREQNLEVIPFGRGGGDVDLRLQYWIGSDVVMATWPLPLATSVASHIPEPGDIMRVRWEQVGPTDLDVRVSYYDASNAVWHADIISGVRPIGNINGVNFADGFHTASSITTDSPFYSIRRYKVGTLATYPTGGNGAPQPAADTATTAQGTPVTIDVLGNDSDPEGDSLTISAVGAAANGSAALGGTAITYTPSTGFCGTDTFTYTVSDGTATATAGVTVTVTCGNRAPIATADTATTAAATPVTVAVLANDSDPDGDALTVTAVQQGSGGTAVVNANGTITFTPGAGVCGATSFGYAIGDGRGGSASATVSVTVTCSPSTPTTVTFQIGASADDVTEVSNTLDATSANAWLGNGGATTGSYTGLRFRNVSIPAGATIRSARLEVRAAQTQWISIAFRLGAEASGNSAAFSTASRPSQRTLVASTVNHSSNVNWTASTWYPLDEMATVVQAVVSRGDWAAGNSLSIIAAGTGGTWSRKFITAFDGAAASAARLIVTYDAAGGPPTNQPPAITGTTVSPTQGLAPLTVNVAATATDPEGGALTYSWAFGDGTTLSSQSGSRTFATPGQYAVRVTVSDGTNQVSSTPITVRVGAPPSATITSPAAGSAFQAGDVIPFSGTATDDEPLGPSNYSWTVFFRRGATTTAVFGPVSGTSGSFTVPTSGQDFSGDTGYEIRLTVTDAASLTDTESVSLAPRKTTVTLATAPAGLALTVDGVARTAPLTLDTLVGLQHGVTAPSTQSLSGTTYDFASWSDGGAASHSIVAAATATTLTATYAARSGPATATFQIADGSDDVNEDGTTFTASGAGVWLGTGASTSASVTGLRFRGLSLPRNATIVSARLEVYSRQQQWQTLAFAIRGESSGNSAAFSTSSRPSARAATTQVVNHNSNVQWLPGTWYPLNDMTAVVQEIVNRADWQAGNALSVVIRGTGGAYARKFVGGYEDGSAQAVRLVVTYQ